MKEKIKKATIFFVTIAAIFWLINFIFLNKQAPKSKATGETIELTYDPTSVTPAVNTDFNVTLKIKPSVDVNLRGYYVNLIFDKSKLQLKKIEYKLGVVSAGLGNSDSDLTAINAGGVAWLIGESQAPAGQVLLTSVTATDLIKLTFTALSTAGTSFKIDTSNANFFIFGSDMALSEIPITAAAQFDVNGGGAITSPAPSITPGGPTLTPLPTGATGNIKLKLKLKFQGILSKPADAYNKLAARVKLLNESTGQSTDYQTGNFTADGNGIWTGEVSFNTNIGAKYIVYVKGNMHIQKKICVVTPTESSVGTYSCSQGAITLNTGDNNLDFSGVTMLAGDLPVQDGVVTAYDTSLVRNNLGKTDADALSKADVNHDGRVDTQDYSLIIAALSVRADEQ